MQFRLSDIDNRSLREQLAQQLRAAILIGNLPPREQLPSIRAMARDLRVGTITVQHAYEELEREGLLYARMGKGYFVAPLSEDTRREMAVALLDESLKPAIRDALDAGLDAREIKRTLNRLIEGGGE